VVGKDDIYLDATPCPDNQSSSNDLYNSFVGDITSDTAVCRNLTQENSDSLHDDKNVDNLLRELRRYYDDVKHHRQLSLRFLPVFVNIIIYNNYISRSLHHEKLESLRILLHRIYLLLIKLKIPFYWILLRLRFIGFQMTLFRTCLSNQMSQYYVVLTKFLPIFRPVLHSQKISFVQVSASDV